MEKTIALAVIIFFGMHLVSRIRFLLANRGSDVVLIRSSIDILITMGILTLSVLQLTQPETSGTARNYTWYILGLVAIYVIWLSNIVRYHRTNQTSNKTKARKNKR